MLLFSPIGWATKPSASLGTPRAPLSLGSPEASVSQDDSLPSRSPRPILPAQPVSLGAAYLLACCLGWILSSASSSPHLSHFCKGYSDDQFFSIFLRICLLGLSCTNCSVSGATTAKYKRNEAAAEKVAPLSGPHRWFWVANRNLIFSLSVFYLWLHRIVEGLSWKELAL